MTTFFQFIPSIIKAPTFMPALDGQQYNCTVIWNVSGQRYYLQCIDQGGNLIFYLPVIETSASFEIIDLIYDDQNTRAVLTTKYNHNVPIGKVIPIVIKNTIPIAYSGSGYASALSVNQLTYNVSPNPGVIMVLGAVDCLINIADGYFIQSTFIFRNRVFETNP